jgi:formamidopyrimidine-DNA glycosylase
MPELPEVQTIVSALRDGGRGAPSISGTQIVSTKIAWHKTVAHPDPITFQGKITGEEIRDIHRRGKFIWIKLRSAHLFIHLRMSGDLRVESSTSPLQSHDRMWLEFSDGLRLVFNATRKFGRVWLVDDPNQIIGNLGPEPLDETLSPEQFHERLLTYRRQIKPLLLDQRFLAGVGNIYSDEALFLAQIHPRRLSHTLNQEETTRLLSAIRQVLEEGIQKNGASIDWVYRGGEFQNSFRVYQRTGEPCLNCGAPIERITVGQRGTHFCPKCQIFNCD